MAEIKKNGGLMTLPVSFARNNSIPIDPTAVWYSYDEMAAYAASNSSAAYVGQILGLVDEINDTSDAYIILNKDGELMKIGSAVVVDNKSIQLAEDGSILLKNFGVQYYKYIAESGTPGAEDYEEAHYELQIVDENNPWKAGLEPKIASEDNELVLAWYEPNPTTIDGINSQVSTLQTTVDDLQEIIGKPTDKEEGIAATGIYAELETKATKIEVEEKIKAAISEADHLARKIVTDVQDIKDYIATHKDAQNYIFMVPTGLEEADDKYNEYIVVLDDLDEEVIEKVGDWEVNLDGYAKLTDLTPYAKKTEVETALDNKVDTKEGYRLMSNQEGEKLGSLANIKAVSATSFTLEEDGTLKFNGSNADISNNTSIITLTGKVNNITESLNNLTSKVNKNEENITSLNNSISEYEKTLAELQSAFNTLSPKVNQNTENITLIQGNVSSVQNELNNLKSEVSTNKNSIASLNDRLAAIQSSMDSFVTTEAYELDMTEIRDILTWKEISII